MSLPYNHGVTCFFDYHDATATEWKDSLGTINHFDLYNPIITDDYVEVVGSDYSYGKITYGGATGGNATNSDFCTRYIIFKNLSGVYYDWRTIVGNETGDSYCSTIAMSSIGNIWFTRADIFSSVKCIDWHIVCVVSNKQTRRSTLYIDGTKIGSASKCNGWASDTYLAKGSTWGFTDNNTAFKCYIISDDIHTDEEVRVNSQYLYNKYLTAWRMNDMGELTNKYINNMPEKAISKPYPLSYWRINEFYNPYHLLFDKDLAYGAFANAVNLSSIRIPPSVKKIGWDAFAHTQLTSVTIARDCEYYETSFPKGCEINFYD